jgi:hypothetical protein
LNPFPPAQVRVIAEPSASRLADTVLALIQADGAVPDVPGGLTVNADSNFLYFLSGLACQARHNPDLWPPVEKGLLWLSHRRWTDSDPLPGAFPDSLPLQGPGLPMGSPPTAAVGATAARFVALVAALPHPPADLLMAARAVWAGLMAWNWVEGKGMRNAWSRDAEGIWRPRSVWYAADQADYEAGRKGALRLGLSPCPRVPWHQFGPGRLALDAAGKAMPLTGPEAGAALAILAFDGPGSWHQAILACLSRQERRHPGFILPLMGMAYLGDKGARSRVVEHLRRNPLPLDRDQDGSPAYTPLAGFALRLFERDAALGAYSGGKTRSKP